MMWGFGFGWAWMILVWIVVIGAIVWAATQLSGGWSGGWQSSSGSSHGARDILDERFARGEIEQDEYRRLRDQLKA